MKSLSRWCSALAAIAGLTFLAIPLAAQERQVDDFEIEDYDYWADLCNELERAEKYPEAIDACETAIEIRPGRKRRTIPVWVSRGNALRHLGNSEEAIASYNHVLDINPDYSLVWMYQCEILLNEGRQELALAACERALEADGNWGDRSPAVAWRIRALVYRDRARLRTRETQALREQLLIAVAGREPTILDDNATDPQNALVAYDAEAAIADLNDILRDLDDASLSYERALALEPNYSLAWAQHCESLTEIGRVQKLKALISGQRVENELGDLFDALYESALVSCDTAIARNRNWEDLTPAIAWAHKAKVLVAWADRQPDFSRYARYLEAAVNAYEQALAIDSEFAQAWVDQGILLQILDRPEKALTSYNEALELLPESSRTLAYRCEVLNQLGDSEAALESCNLALDGDRDWTIENTAQAWNQRSAALVGLGEYEAALESVERAIALYDPNLLTQVYTSPDAKLSLDTEIDFPTVDPELIPILEEPLEQCSEIGTLPARARQDFNRNLDRYRRALNNKAVSLWHLGRYQDARLYAQLALSPQSIRLIDVSLVQTDRDARQAIACNYPEAWFNYGRIVSQLGDFSSAIQAYAQALETYSLYLAPELSNTSAISGRSGVISACNFFLGKGNSLDTLTQAQARHNRMCFSIYLNQGAALLQETCQDFVSCQKAKESLEKAVELQPNSFVALYNYGLALTANREYAEAIVIFDRAEQLLDPEDSTTGDRLMFARSNTLYRWANFLTNESTEDIAGLNEALSLVEDALQLNPQYSEALQLRDRLLRAISELSNVTETL